MNWICKPAQITPFPVRTSEPLFSHLLTLEQGMQICSPQNTLFELAEHEFAVICSPKGGLQVQTAGCHHTLPAGAVITLNPFQGVCCLSGEDTVFFLVFTGSICEAIFSELIACGNLIYQHAATAVKLFCSVAQNARKDESDISAAAYQFFLQLRKCTKQTMQQYPLIVEAALQVIAEEYAHLQGVPDLAQRVEVSTGYLSRLFQKSVGISPAQYLTQIRLIHAKQFLQQPGMSVAMVADLCGFSCANYFAKVFRQQVGISPSEFAQQHQTQTAELPEEIYVI